MKRYSFLIVLIVCAFQGKAQVSVFDCGLYAKHLTQAQMNASPQINGMCIFIGDNGAIQLKNHKNVTVTAENEIVLTGDVTLGSFAEDGEVHLKTTGFAKSPMDVVVMNYTTLDAVLRYKKLEFGVEIPPEVLTRIDHFLHEKGIYSDELNPFLEWQVDVEATFEHVATGKTVKVDGFYTREYVENPNTDDWDDVGTNYPFRIRFAPPNNGEWRARVALRLKNGQEIGYQSSDFLFKVIESGDPGYVTVHENKRNLKQGNRMIFPVGHNLPNPDFYNSPWGGAEYEQLPDGVHILNPKTGEIFYYGHNLFSNTNTEKAANVYLCNYYLKMVSEYLNKGGKFIRTMQAPWGSLIEFEEKGNYYKRLHYAYEQDKLMDTLEKYDALALFNMMYQTPLFRYDVYGGWMWDWEDDMYDGNGQLETHSTGYPRYCYNDKPPHQKLPYEMFTNESDLGYHKQRMRYYIARYGYSTKIYEFELLSEPFHIGEQKMIKNSAGDTTVFARAPYKNPNDGEYNMARDAVLNYHRVIASYIKDSLQWHNQLIGVDMGYLDGGSLKPYDFRNSSLPQIDIAAFNAYYFEPDAVYKIEDFVQKIWDDRGTDMPVLLSEVGTNPGYDECANYTQQPVDMMTLGFTKVAGFHPWTGYSADFDWNYTNFWKHTIRAQYHMNGDDVIGTLSQGGGKWGFGKEDARVKNSVSSSNDKFVETQYYGGYHADKVVGYVKNRTYNIRTNGCNSVDFDNHSGFHYLKSISENDIRIGNKISIISLKNLTKYYVDWYSFKDGSYLKTDYIKTNFIGTLKLDFPTLSADNPVVWYVVHENAYSGMMKQDNPLVERERVDFDFQQVENDTTNISFTNAIYPNPFQNEIVVNSLEEDEFILTSPAGNVIFQSIVHKGNNKIRIGDLPNGLYFAELKNQGFIVKLERL